MDGPNSNITSVLVRRGNQDTEYSETIAKQKVEMARQPKQSKPTKKV